MGLQEESLFLYVFQTDAADTGKKLLRNLQEGSKIEEG